MTDEWTSGDAPGQPAETPSAEQPGAAAPLGPPRAEAPALVPAPEVPAAAAPLDIGEAVAAPPAVPPWPESSSSYGPGSVAYAPGYVHIAWAVAGLGVMGALLGRAIAPALAGVWVGVDRIISSVEMVSAVTAQLFAVLAVALMIGLVVAVSRSSWPVGYRAFAVAVVGLSTLAVTSAMFMRLPDVSGVAAGGTASLLALLVARYSLPMAESRAAAMVLGGIGVGGLLRMGAIGCVTVAQEADSAVLPQLAAVLATSAFVAHGIALIVGLGWLSWRPGRPWQVAVGVLLLGLAAGVVALGLWGARAEATGLAVLTNRAVALLLSAPTPLVPAVVQAFAAVVAWLLAVAVLFKPWPMRLMPPAVCLALVGQGAVEAPLCALALVLAALMVSAGPQRLPRIAARAAR